MLGVTPSIGLIEQAVSIIGGRNIALHVLIRPRPGGFVYTADEFDVIQRDILAAKAAGADGKIYFFFQLKYYSKLLSFKIL
jgi:copper homeostasis protein